MSTSTQYVELRVGETLQLTGSDGRPINLTLREKSGQRARISIAAPRDVKIARPAKRE